MDTLPARGGSSSSLLAAGRLECKYLVDPMLVPSLRHFVQTLARTDPLATALPDHRYPVCSLYLDTQDLRFYWQYKRGERSRFKLRARTYSDDLAAPVFLEVKWRVNRLVAKQRAVLTRDEARSVLEHRTDGRIAQRLPARCALDAFTTDLALTSARPIVRVKYKREAYVATGPVPARITFDTCLECQPTFDPTLSHTGGHWLPVPLREVVVEIKSVERFPAWIEDMIRAFGLVQQPCCKYALSVERMLARGGAGALSLAGFVLPPSLRAAS